MNIILRYKNLGKSAKSGIVLSLFGILGWGLAILIITVFAYVFGQDSDIGFFDFFVVPMVFVIGGVAVNFLELYKKLGIHPTFFTTSTVGLHGIWGLIVGLQLHPEYNGFVILFLFSFGLLYLKMIFGFVGTVIFAAFNILLSLALIHLLEVDYGTDETIFLFYFGFSGISSAFINEINRKRNRQLKQEISLREHGYRQLQKVYYPHQLSLMAQGEPIEKTMPEQQGLGCCLLFEIIDSSKIKHELAAPTFREIFSRFSLIVCDEYDIDRQQSKAFRIAELNNKFVCTIGFPMSCPDGNRPSKVALTIAEEFIRVFNLHIARLDYPMPIDCSIAIASGELEGFYTRGFPIEYHVSGEPLVAVESINEARKLFKSTHKGVSTIVLQEQVFCSLSGADRKRFAAVDWQALSGTTKKSSATSEALYIFEISTKQDSVIAA